MTWFFCRGYALTCCLSVQGTDGRVPGVGGGALSVTSDLVSFLVISGFVSRALSSISPSISGVASSFEGQTMQYSPPLGLILYPIILSSKVSENETATGMSQRQ